MIACYPKFYDDELVYSFLARYFERTGYINYVDSHGFFAVFCKLHNGAVVAVFVGKFKRKAHEFIAEFNHFRVGFGAVAFPVGK